MAFLTPVNNGGDSSDKIDKVPTAALNDIPIFNSDGELSDSNLQPSDFAQTEIDPDTIASNDILVYSEASGKWENRSALPATFITGLSASSVGLGNVTNTSDANKPVSTAQQTALNLKADKTITVTGGGLITGGGGIGSNQVLTLSGATILTDLLTRDGSGSGLDADKLRGVTPSAFALTVIDDADAAATLLTLGAASLSAAQSLTGLNTFAPTPSGGAAAQDYGLKITPNASQTSTATFTSLFINDTGTYGSGTHLLADFQLGGVSKVSINASGTLTLVGSVIGTAALFTNNIVSNRGNIVTTSTDGLTATNTFAATSGVPVQISPRFRLTGTVWDTTSVSSRIIDSIIELAPVSGASPSSLLKVGFQYNAGGYTYPISFSSTGAITAGALSVTSITNSGLTATRIPYASTGGLLADDAQFTWDATNHRLGVGKAPRTTFHIAVSTDATTEGGIQITPTTGATASGVHLINGYTSATGFTTVATTSTADGIEKAAIKLGAAQTISLRTANTDRLTINSSGNSTFAGTITATGLTIGSTTLSAFITTLLDDANAATARATLGAQSAPVVVGLTDGATIPTDCSLGTHYRVTIAGNRTLSNPTNPVDGSKYTWEIIQDATGTRTLALDTKFAFGTDIPSISLTTTANKRDFISAIYNSTADKFFVVGFVRGF